MQTDTVRDAHKLMYRHAKRLIYKHAQQLIYTHAQQLIYTCATGLVRILSGTGVWKVLRYQKEKETKSTA